MVMVVNKMGPSSSSLTFPGQQQQHPEKRNTDQDPFSLTGASARNSGPYIPVSEIPNEIRRFFSSKKAKPATYPPPLVDPGDVRTITLLAQISLVVFILICVLLVVLLCILCGFNILNFSRRKKRPPPPQRRTGTTGSRKSRLETDGGKVGANNLGLRTISGSNQFSVNQQPQQLQQQQQEDLPPLPSLEHGGLGVRHEPLFKKCSYNSVAGLDNPGLDMPVSSGAGSSSSSSASSSPLASFATTPSSYHPRLSRGHYSVHDLDQQLVDRDRSFTIYEEMDPVPPPPPLELGPEESSPSRGDVGHYQAPPTLLSQSSSSSSSPSWSGGGVSESSSGSSNSSSRFSRKLYSNTTRVEAAVKT